MRTQQGDPHIERASACSGSVLETEALRPAPNRELALDGVGEALHRILRERAQAEAQDESRRCACASHWIRSEAINARLPR